MIGLLLGAALAANSIASWELEQDDGGLVPAEDDLQWEWGALPDEYGPMGGGTGRGGWATHLASPYFNDATGILVLPPLDLTPYARPMLTLLHWYDVASGDLAQVLVADGEGGWVVLEPVYGYPVVDGWSGRSAGWERAYVDLRGVTGLDTVALALVSDATVQRPGWYVDELALWDGDIAPPLLSNLSALPDTEDVLGPYEVSVEARDNAPLVSIELHYQVDQGPTAVVSMSPVGGDTWSADIPGVVQTSAVVAYRVRATDGENETWLPERDWSSFRVRLPAPENLRGPEGRIVNTVASLDWDPPSSTQQILSYRVFRGDEPVAETAFPPVDVPLAGHARDTYTVRAVYEAGEGDESDPLSLDVALPELRYVGPASAYQGDAVRLEIMGNYLLLRQDDLEAALGEGVTVERVEVLSVDEALLSLVIAEDATLGTRDLVLWSGDVEVRAPAAFSVLDGAGRPRLTGLEPAELRQGERATLTLSGSADFAELPLVDLGEGIVVEDARFVDVRTLELDVVVGPTAPVGERPVRADDGHRIHEGVGFTVRDYVPPPTGTCAHAPAGGWSILALLLLRRRARTAE